MTQFRFRPVYVAVFLCALAVVALGQPYWHPETKEKVLDTFSYYDVSSIEVMEAVLRSSDIKMRYEKTSFSFWYGSSSVTWTYDVTLYQTYDETIYDSFVVFPQHEDAGGWIIPATVCFKLPVAFLFLAIVLGAVLWDAGRQTP